MWVTSSYKHVTSVEKSLPGDIPKMKIPSGGLHAWGLNPTRIPRWVLTQMCVVWETVLPNLCTVSLTLRKNTFLCFLFKFFWHDIKFFRFLSAKVHVFLSAFWWSLSEILYFCGCRQKFLQDNTVVKGQVVSSGYISWQGLERDLIICQKRYCKLPWPHWTENPIYVFPEMKLRGLVPNSYIHGSVSDLYVSRSGLLIW
jgi:hypothetical protein